MTVEKTRAERAEGEKISQNDELKIELEQTQTHIALKEKQLEDTLQDLDHLNNVVKDMTQLNNELNEKVASLNSDVESTIRRSSIFLPEMPNFEEIEKTLAESDEHNKNL